ncbi:V-type ATP synthase subunit I [Pyrodictium delaneyi]|uniref:A-type ATP synthase subunit I n=1 Tax=Pyrodictium delaneyi TaxID=1273541 RepID=A0A0P0N3X7_9CREN|nr:V-type ATP synthase subunit I [Pyrodictium delaneyi]
MAVAATATLIAQSTSQTYIIIPRDRLAYALKALAECNCFHPEPEQHAAGSEFSARIRHIKNELDTLEQRLREMLKVAESTGLGEEQAVSEQVLRLSKTTDMGLSRVIEQLTTAIQDIEKLVERLAQLKSPESELATLLAVLETYSFIDVDIEALKRGSYIRAKVYRVPTDRTQAFLRDLETVGAIAGLHVSGIETNMDTVVVAYPAWLEAEVGKTALRNRATPLEIPEDMPRIPSEALKKVRKELDELPVVLKRHLPKLREALAVIDAAKSLLSLLEATKLTQLVAVVSGYVAPEKEPVLRRTLESLGAGYVGVMATPSMEGHHGHGEEELPPSYFTIPSKLTPFASLLEMAGHPRPREFVPLALLAVTLPIVYGFMFPDLGHGLALLLAGYYLFYKKMGNRDLGRLVMIFGVAAMAVGFFAGEFFGPHPAVAGWLDAIWHGHPPLASPLHPFVKEMAAGGLHGGEELAEEAKLLIFHAIYVSLAIGSLLLALSSWISVANGALLRDKEVLAAGIGKSLVFTGILIAIVIGGMVGSGGTAIERAGSVLYDAGLTLTPQTALGTLVRLMVTVGLLVLLASPILFGHGSTGERIVNGVMEAFDVLLMAIGNTASFMRIMGLMLAHSGLMFGFTILAFIAGPVLGAIAYILGNLLVIGLEALVAYAHSLRLHFYEMFSKFYMDGGRPYSPVRMPELVKLEIEKR